MSISNIDKDAVPQRRHLTFYQTKLILNKKVSINTNNNNNNNIILKEPIHIKDSYLTERSQPRKNNWCWVNNPTENNKNNDQIKPLYPNVSERELKKKYNNMYSNTLGNQTFWNWTNKTSRSISNHNSNKNLPTLNKKRYDSLFNNIININKPLRQRDMTKNISEKHTQYLISKKTWFNYRNVSYPSKHLSPAPHNLTSNTSGTEAPVIFTNTSPNIRNTKNIEFTQRFSRNRLTHLLTPLSNNPNNVAPMLTNYNQGKTYINYNWPKKITKFENFSAITNQGKTSGGILKLNQDNYLILTNVPYPLKLFGVFDGHGELGHFVSGFLCQYFNDFFLKGKTSEYFTSNHFTSDSLLRYFTSNNNEFIISLFNTLDKEVYWNQQKTNQNYSYSGTTCNLVWWWNNHILSVNVGDSRSIMITSSNCIIQWSRDHKPEWEDEEKRITEMNGKVEKSSNSGPYRVWCKSGDVPGLAISRSIGDFVAKSVGVICEPEVTVWNNEVCNCTCIVIASDGVWEYMTNEKVKNIVMKYYKSKNAEEAGRAVANKAKEMWENKGDIVDDITVVVIFFD